jgi:transposase-like protein
MTVSSLQSEISRLEEEKKALEKRIRDKRVAQLAALPASVGLRSIDELIRELAPLGSQGGHAGARSKSGEPRAQLRKTPAIHPATEKQYSPKVRERVKAAFLEGIKTLSDVSREEGVPALVLKKWRREWGLVGVRGRGKTAGNGASA